MPPNRPLYSHPDADNRHSFQFDMEIPPLTADLPALLPYTKPPPRVDSTRNNALDALSFAASQAASSELQSPEPEPNTSSSRKLTRKLVPILPRPDIPRPEPEAEKAYRRPRRKCDICNGYFGNLSTHKSVHISKDFRSHICFVCGRKFSRTTDLSRHEQLHRGAAYKCPLYCEKPLPADVQSVLNILPSCHQNGCFTRGDTYKNHLKSMHFEYPSGTRKADRRASRGNCQACGQMFDNADIWMSSHIETGICSGVQTIAKTQSQMLT
ncbi:Transcriptional regulator STP4 [Wickerhamiella sorbophila]|uniref:Transcriptional regulator STP4 n=1 Tax=Wickerhamiella sorbophila TaxID=45607 RepID=A0A2T0FNP9_9ASCO|nr:Transcriptional regulator STP4 [Wickerhamiella sorbophila]PRT56610.1 Transcriptional regulator STP4 [Wickerhamiella sorbophila]